MCRREPGAVRGCALYAHPTRAPVAAMDEMRRSARPPRATEARAAIAVTAFCRARRPHSCEAAAGHWPERRSPGALGRHGEEISLTTACDPLSLARCAPGHRPTAAGRSPA